MPEPAPPCRAVASAFGMKLEDLPPGPVADRVVRADADRVLAATGELEALDVGTSDGLVGDRVAVDALRIVVEELEDVRLRARHRSPAEVGDLAVQRYRQAGWRGQRRGAGRRGRRGR